MEWTLIIISFVLVLGAQGIVSLTYNKYKLVEDKKGLSGFDVARQILDDNGLQDVLILETEGTMTDHYDPRRKTVKLSSEVYHDNTIAAVAIAAHECGHVIQHKNKYAPLMIRNAIVPVVNLASQIGYIVLIIGFIASLLDLAMWGIILLCATLVFQLITLPVEFNASRRAIKILETKEMIEKDEKGRVQAMLTSAAFTYVASLLANFLEIFRLFLMARNRD